MLGLFTVFFASGLPDQLGLAGFRFDEKTGEGMNRPESKQWPEEDDGPVLVTFNQRGGSSDHEKNHRKDATYTVEERQDEERVHKGTSANNWDLITLKILQFWCDCEL